MICCFGLDYAVHRAFLYSSNKLDIGTKRNKEHNQCYSVKGRIIKTNNLGQSMKNIRMKDFKNRSSSATRIECSSADRSIPNSHTVENVICPRNNVGLYYTE